MAVYEQATFSSSQRLSKIAHEEKLFRDWIKESVIGPMITDGDTGPVQRKRVAKGEGDVVYFGLRARNTESFIMDGPAEGNEMSLSTYSFSVTMHLFRAAVRYNTKMTVQRAAFDVPMEAQEALGDNYQENLEALYFEALYDGVSDFLYHDASNQFLTTTTKATAKTAATAASTSGLSAQFLSRSKGHMDARRGTGYPPIKPVKVKGYNKPLFIVVTHPHSLSDLWNDGTFLTGQRECLARSNDHPIFMQAESIYAGHLILQSEHVSASADYGAGTVYGCEAKVLGRQALALAIGDANEKGGSMSMVGPVEFDYGREKGYEAHTILGLRKTIFNSKDYGSRSMILACTDLR